MPSFPINVTPGDHDGPNGNPWIDFGDDHNISILEHSANSSTPEPPDLSCHKRSQTTAGHPLHYSSSSPTEMQTAGAGRGSSSDLHETRPSLRRALNASQNNIEGEVYAENNDKPPTGVGEREAKKQTDAEVIVHQIQPGDSLPGVALKYNVSLATLRTANKLWASDSIHLRQELYIPIQSVVTETSRSRPSTSSTSVHSSPTIGTRKTPQMRRSLSEWNTNDDSGTTTTHASTVHTISAGSNSTIRRIPLSELSFFPPPSALPSPNNINAHTRPLGQEPSSPFFKFGTVTLPPSSSFSTFPSPRGTPTTLASFLNGAKDEIISRLSFDSARGSSSDAGDEHEVELAVVRPRGIARRRWSNESHDELYPAAVRERDGISQSSMRITDGPVNFELEGVLSSTTPRKPKVIRSVQLQPSPKMKIPTRPGVDKTPNGAGSVILRTSTN